MVEGPRGSRGLSSGTVNAIFRIGHEFAARFPLRAQDPTQARADLTAEAAAAREFACASTVPTPEPVAIGEPGHGYPLPWSIQTWLAGSDATVDDPAGSIEFANDLAAFVAGLRAADTAGRRFTGDGRGGHLPGHDAWMEVRFGESEGLLDVARLRVMWARLRVMWARLRTLPEVDADVMCHGDLTPPNVLVRGGRLVGVLDGGGFAAADPALDLVAAWHLLDEGQRQVLREALGCSEVQWRRAWPGPSSSRWAWFGTTPSRIRP